MRIGAFSESTGSFFPDRSTTLGTLMGLTSPVISASRDWIPSGRRIEVPASIAGGGGIVDQKPKVRRPIGSGGWWRLCRGDMGPTTLEEFLQTERRLGAAEGDFLSGGEAAGDHEVVGAGKLFEDGRVLPPAPPLAPTSSDGRRRRREGETTAGSIARLPVLIAGICGGGEG
ncbi:hypothetical protein KSP40_PGU007277 [Platanthera guangdongensis]|uniref:Uncharacterized protein n=1 Tax=Platanthera guangdongensis TaxID=2320717 RepID=A0ABR2M4K4_9ASPA